VVEILLLDSVFTEFLFINGTKSAVIMGKLNVTVLRYLTKEDFRVLTAVGIFNSVYVKFT
jgi:hypothetical protein